MMNAKVRNQNWRDPVSAYDLISPLFPALCMRRKHYLDAVDELVIARISLENRSLLDVGTGDGGRASKISSRTGIANTFLLEPSQGMSRRISEASEIWNMRAEGLSSSRHITRFDVITCLWNVLGHIQTTNARQNVLRQLRQLLTPVGRMFLDVNHRYNARAYGRIKSALRFTYDQPRPSDENGDVTAHWSVGGIEFSTYGHPFSETGCLCFPDSAENFLPIRRHVQDVGGVLPSALPDSNIESGQLNRRRFNDAAAGVSCQNANVAEQAQVGDVVEVDEQSGVAAAGVKLFHPLDQAPATCVRVGIKEDHLTV